MIQSDREAIRSYELEPRSTERPAQKWCPICGRTIIEQYQDRCEDCLDALQSEDR